ncbi:MAG: hypothetical protein KatS3mg113_0540 [Planctomycetaceae bacterium]|nr:MAG: hypothetical protein KatS3mg113_0540 [Planctomycetaceae bacterium]
MDVRDHTALHRGSNPVVSNSDLAIETVGWLNARLREYLEDKPVEMASESSGESAPHPWRIWWIGGISLTLWAALWILLLSQP